MKRLKCIMCGGDIIADEEQPSAVCPYCGNIQRVVVQRSKGKIDHEQLRAQCMDAAVRERSAVGTMRSNWEGRLAGIDIEREKRESENTACVLKAQKTEKQFLPVFLTCAILLVLLTLAAVFLHWIIFAAIAAIPVLLVLIKKITALPGCRRILSQYGRTKEYFDTISNPLLAGEKIRKANPKRLQQIIDENNAYMEQLSAERAEVERRVELFSRYLRHPDRDVAACIYAMRCAEAGETVPTDEVFRAVRDKALAEMKEVSWGNTQTRVPR